MRSARQNLVIWVRLSVKRKKNYIKIGKNPILNQQLAQLKGLEAQIRDEEAKLLITIAMLMIKISRHVILHLKDNLSQFLRCMLRNKRSGST